MRLLFTLINFPPSIFGGIASCIFPVVQELNNVPNINVRVLTTIYKIPKDELPITNCWITYKKIPICYIRVKNPSFSFQFFLAGVRQIKECDKVYLNSFFFFPSLVFLIFSVIFKKETFLLPHGELLKPALKRKYWKKKPYLLLFKLFQNKVTFISTSIQEYSEINRIFPRVQVKVIPNLIEFREPLMLNKENYFLFLGRISNIKRIENLINACLLSKYFISHHYMLLIAGPNDKESVQYEIKLKNLVITNKIENNIRFLGEVYSPEKEELISKSKALFVVSDSENFSNVVVESLAQGTPVVASRGTPWGNLTVNNAGFWIDNSPEQIYHTIDNLILMDNDSYQKMSKNALTLSKYFTKENILPKWMDTINITNNARK